MESWTQRDQGRDVDFWNDPRDPVHVYGNHLFTGVNGSRCPFRRLCLREGRFRRTGDLPLR